MNTIIPDDISVKYCVIIAIPPTPPLKRSAGTKNPLKATAHSIFAKSINSILLINNSICLFPVLISLKIDYFIVYLLIYCIMKNKKR